MRPSKATSLAIAGLIGLGMSNYATAAPKAASVKTSAKQSTPTKPAVKKTVAKPAAPPPATVPVALQNDVKDLKTQVSTLVDQQQKILDQIDQLKTLIQNQQQAAAPPAAPPTNYPTSLDVAGLPVEGGENAHVAIVEFTDFQCPFCGRYTVDAYPSILAQYIQTGKVKYFYRDDPLSFHEFATPAAKAAHCAEEQGKFWEMHDSLFANQNALAQQDIADRAQKIGLDTTKFSQCIASNKFDDTMNKSITEAGTWGVNGTPTFFIGIIGADGKVMSVDKEIVGAQPFQAFKEAIEAELAPRA